MKHHDSGVMVIRGGRGCLSIPLSGQPNPQRPVCHSSRDSGGFGYLSPMHFWESINIKGNITIIESVLLFWIAIYFLNFVYKILYFSFCFHFFLVKRPALSLSEQVVEPQRLSFPYCTFDKVQSKMSWGGVGQPGTDQRAVCPRSCEKIQSPTGSFVLLIRHSPERMALPRCGRIYQSPVSMSLE